MKKKHPKSDIRRRAVFLFKSRGYNAYLHSLYWKRIRKALFPFPCLLCGRDAVNLHHTEYKNIGHETCSEIIPLCRTCHENIHSILDVEFSHLKSYSKARKTKNIWRSINRGKDLSVTIRQSGWQDHFKKQYLTINFKQKKKSKKNINKRKKRLAEMQANREYHERMCNS